MFRDCLTTLYCADLDAALRWCWRRWSPPTASGSPTWPTPTATASGSTPSRPRTRQPPSAAARTRMWVSAVALVAPAEAARWLAGQLPRAELTELSGAGHDLTDDSWPEIYGWLLARSATTSTSKPSASAR